ncbi:MAG: hypothetical protein F4038_11210 [Chloroflexi bacterium]|nr:hypothetical protein [Chloroflexota bacterium]MYG90581.1 hypothetical protein [Chloroflexota bacterium]MYJ93597.1 hypothetical protein [Chloroflexota bacterium]
MAEHRYEHSRTRLGSLPSRAWDTMGPRMLRPLIGGAVGAAIVVLFLAIRGGTAVELNELTGTAWGGWSRHADVHLLIVVNAAVAVAIAVNFAAEWIHNWIYISLAVVSAGVMIALRQLAGIDGAGGNIMLGLIAFFLLLGVAIAAWDVRAIGRRSGY